MSANRPRRRVGLLAAVATASVAVAAMLVGCSTPGGSGAVVEPASQSVKNLLIVDGLERGVIIEDAADVTALVPALIMLHGATGSGTRMQNVTGMDAIAAENNFVVAYPDGTDIGKEVGGYAWNAGSCCGKPVTTAVDDVAFIAAVIDELVANHGVDPERVYLSGFSNGGMLSYRYACDSGLGISGIAVVGGALNVESCEAPSVLPVLVIHGTADPTVPYNGGPPAKASADRIGSWENASVASAAAYWSERSSCTSHEIERLADNLIEDEYTGCAVGASLRIVSLEGVTHHWPNEERDGVSASALIAAYFGLAPAA
jgi:polyhydroxybutyrate depolymerase